MTRLGRIAGTLTLVAAALACGGEDTAVSGSDSAVGGSIEGAWGLTVMEVNGQAQVLPPDLTTDRPDQVTWIMFADDGTVTGELPCNEVAGEYQLAGSEIIWEVVIDAAFCLEPVGAMEAEETMTRVIWSPNVDVEVSGSGDVLSLSAKGVVLEFAPITP